MASAARCGQRHPEAWKSATFAHAECFALDGDYGAACVACHTGNGDSCDTGCGCHGHTPAHILRKHRDEGIANLDNCVDCHRSAKGEREGGGCAAGKGCDGGKRDWAQT